MEEESEHNSSSSSDQENFSMVASDDENFSTEVSDDENSSLLDTQLASDSEKQKICEEITETSSVVVDNEDRISKLPDSVIRRILSFITDTKAAARTSIVAKRWINLWLSPSNDIDLDDSVLYNRGNKVNETAFMNFVEKVLSFHDNNKSVISEFKLKCGKDFGLNYDLWRESSWISFIADFEIKELVLSFAFWNIYKRLNLPCSLCRLPSSFFSSEHLVTMKLSYMMFHVPSCVNFPNLKKLSFICLNLLGDDPVKNFLSGCPTLHHFDVVDTSWEYDVNNRKPTYIQSSTLFSLFLESRIVFEEFGKIPRIIVETPNIDVLRLSGNLEYDYDFGDLSSLKAFYLGSEKDGLVSPGTNVLSERMVALLEKVSHVEELGFLKYPVRFLEHASFENFPVFHNLKVLRVYIADYSWRILPLLLERLPNLVSFVSCKEFEEGKEFTRNSAGYGWHPPHCVPKCLVSTLKYIEFEEFENYMDEIEMIGYFLKNAMVLRKITIGSRNLSLDTQSLVIRKILMFPRSSNDCGILFS